MLTGKKRAGCITPDAPRFQPTVVVFASQYEVLCLVVKEQKIVAILRNDECSATIFNRIRLDKQAHHGLNFARHFCTTPWRSESLSRIWGFVDSGIPKKLGLHLLPKLARVDLRMLHNVGVQRTP